MPSPILIRPALTIDTAAMAPLLGELGYPAPVAMVTALVVAERARGLGAGAALLEGVRAFAERHGAHRLVVATKPDAALPHNKTGLGNLSPRPVHGRLP